MNFITVIDKYNYPLNNDISFINEIIIGLTVPDILTRLIAIYGIIMIIKVCHAYLKSK